MGADHDHIVRVAIGRLCEYVVGCGLSAEHIGNHVHHQARGGRPGLAQRIGGKQHGDSARVVGAQGTVDCTAAIGGVALVEDDGPHRAGRSRVLSLQLEGAGAALDQRDTPRREAGEVRGLTPAC